MHSITPYSKVRHFCHSIVVEYAFQTVPKHNYASKQGDHSSNLNTLPTPLK